MTPGGRGSWPRDVTMGNSISEEGNVTVISKKMRSILDRPESARQVQAAITTGQVARVQGDGGKQYLVFTTEAQHLVKSKKK